jgi:hypothetical protein
MFVTIIFALPKIPDGAVQVIVVDETLYGLDPNTNLALEIQPVIPDPDTVLTA